MQQSVRDVRSLRREYDLVVDARGAHAGTANAVALRAYWTVPRGLLAPGDEATVQIHTDRAFARGYGWMFPVAHEADAVRVNIGVGLWAADSVTGHSIADFYERFVTTNPVLVRWRSGAAIGRAVGCHVGLGGDRYAVADPHGVFRIGDAANLADPLTGDGIANAIRSGRLVAAAIGGAPDARTAASAWQAAHDRVFVPEFGRARRLQRALVRTGAKNSAAILLAMAPWARRRVHAAMFGEAPYTVVTQPWRRVAGPGSIGDAAD
jgi:flavin-dependent dehydrogenase